MDKESRTATSTLTQPLSSLRSVLLYVPRDRKDCYGQGVQDGHLDSHTAAELFKFSVGLRP